MPNNHNNQLSTVLDVLRFPMIVLVLFMHVVPISANAIPHEFSWESLYVLKTEFVEHNFGRIALPIFFLSNMTANFSLTNGANALEPSLFLMCYGTY